MRQAQLARKTKETDIQVTVKLDNMGTANINTGIGFFDHMLTALSVHSGISMDIAVKGDLYVDGHHTVEDTGIVLGKALGEALATSPASHAMAARSSPWTKHWHFAAWTSATARSWYSRGHSPTL